MTRRERNRPAESRCQPPPSFGKDATTFAPRPRALNRPLPSPFRQSRRCRSLADPIGVAACLANGDLDLLDKGRRARVRNAHSPSFQSRPLFAADHEPTCCFIEVRAHFRTASCDTSVVVDRARLKPLECQSEVSANGKPMRIIDGRLERQRCHRANAWNCCEPPANRVLADDAGQSIMQPLVLSPYGFSDSEHA